MSQSSGVRYEVPGFTDSPVPTAPMLSTSQNVHSLAHANPNMDPALANMDSDLSPITEQSTRSIYPALAPQEASLQLQLQAAAATEATFVGQAQGGPLQGALSAASQLPKHRRLGRACDACSKRKVKCNGSVPCKNCVDLQIHCTFQRPARRRGPANRVAEDLLKRQTMGTEDMSLSSFVNSGPQSSTSIESIAPYEKVYRLMFDFFTYLYPIYPFPPEAPVLSRLNKREDQYNKSFLALIASMIALLASAFPKLLQETLPECLSANSTYAFAQRCTDIASSSRVTFRESCNIDDAMTSFFSAITAQINGHPWMVSSNLAESLSVIRQLGVLPIDGRPMECDAVTEELTLRLFWAIYAATRSQHHQVEGENLVPPCRGSQLPALPALSDDFVDYIHYGHEVNAQLRQDKFPLIQGFKIHARILSAHHSLLAYSILEDSERSIISDSMIALVQNCLNSLDGVLNKAHPELSSLPAPGYLESHSHRDLMSAPHLRAHVQTEIQKIVIRTNLLSTRLYLTNRFAELRDINPAMLLLDTPFADVVVAQYGMVIKEMALLLNNVSKASTEPCIRLIEPMLAEAYHAVGQCAAGIEFSKEEYGVVKARFGILFGKA